MLNLMNSSNSMPNQDILISSVQQYQIQLNYSAWVRRHDI